MPEGGRRSSVERPKPRYRGVNPPMSPMARFQRGRVIAEMRAREKPVAWSIIAKQVSMSVSGVKEAYANFLEWEEPLHDPLEVVQETIDALTVTMHEAMRNAEDAPAGSSVRTQTLRLGMDAAIQRLTVMRAAGRAPQSLAMPSLQQATQLVFRDFIDILRRYELPPEATDELLTLVDRNMGGGAIEGTVSSPPVEALPSVT